jgi:hypothetical protein
MTFAARNGDFATENLDLGGGLHFVPVYDSASLTLVASSTDSASPLSASSGGAANRANAAMAVASRAAVEVRDSLFVAPRRSWLETATLDSDWC